MFFSNQIDYSIGVFIFYMVIPHETSPEVGRFQLLLFWFMNKTVKA